MITVKEAVLRELGRDYVAIQAISRGIMNLSEYARLIKPEVEFQSKKLTSVQSIVVALSRIVKEVKKPELQDVTIEQLTVQSPVTQIIYPRTDSNLAALLEAARKIRGGEHSFFSFTTSTKDIAFLASESAVSSILAEFEEKPLIEKPDLSAISIRFPVEGVNEANVGLSILSKLATKNIPLDAALTTYNEFTLVLESSYLEVAVSTLSPRTKIV